jgi:hypothetical protein
VGCKKGHNISPHKTAIVPFTNRSKIEGIGPLNLHGKDLKMLNEVKYLGGNPGIQTYLEPAFTENN